MDALSKEEKRVECNIIIAINMLLMSNVLRSFKEPNCPLFVLYISLTVIFYYLFYFSVASSALGTTTSSTTLSGAKYTTPQNVTRVTVALKAEKTTMIHSTTGNKCNYRNISNFPVLHFKA